MWVENEGTIVNLHPDFLIPEEYLHEEHVFPSLLEMMRLRKDGKLIDVPMGSKEQKIGRCHTDIDKEWTDIKRAWSQFSKGNTQIADEITKNCSKQYLHQTDITDTEEWIHQFAQRVMTSSKIAQFESALNVATDACKNNAANASHFFKYYKDNFYMKNMTRYFETFLIFFSAYAEFSQVILYTRTGAVIPDSLEVSSTNFKKVKSIYGECYENITSSIIYFPCISNIIKGRRFDTFEKMDLAKYFTINKAGRCECFSDIPEFTAVVSCLQSTIRNSAYHASMQFIAKTREIEYRSGGTGATKRIKYLEYLRLCCELLLTSATMLALEMPIARIKE
jgi:hypothetical protein